MKYPLFKVHMPDNVVDELSKVLYSGYIAEGEYVRKFENKLKDFCLNDNMITTNSCTSALHLCLHLCEANRFGSHVLTTPMTCIASNVSIVNIGASVHWVDVDPKHGMMSPMALERHLSTWASQCNAVLYVCWGGDLGPLAEISGLCKKYKVLLIVDAAQAFGLVYDNGRGRLGDCVHGDFVTFSFQAIKGITTGDGGAIFFKNKKRRDRAFKLKWFGVDRNDFRNENGEISWDSDVKEIGYKFHMNDIAGCIGYCQMEDRLRHRLLKNMSNDLLLTEMLKGDLERSWDGDSASWVATFNCENPIGLIEFLREHGIHSSQMHVSNNVYSGFNVEETDLPNTEIFMNHHISLPCGWWMNDNDINYIAEKVIGYE